MKKNGSVRKYADKLLDLVDQYNPTISKSTVHDWFINELPSKIARYVRREGGTTLEEAKEATQKYVDSEISERKQVKKDLKKERRKRRGKSKSKSYSSTEDTSSGSSTSSTSEAPSDSSSSDGDSTTSDTDASAKKKKKHKEEKKNLSKAKDSRLADDNKSSQHAKMDKMIVDITGNLSKLSVNIVALKPVRRVSPALRINVWCAHCNQHGHYPNEYLVVRTTINYLEEQEETEVYDYDPTYGIEAANGGQYFPPTSIVLHWTPPKPAFTRPVPRPPMGPPGGYPSRGAPRARGPCWNYGQPDHYSPQCPYPKQEVKYTPVCGNCGKKGHLPVECPSPPKPKMMVRFAQEPVKDLHRPEAKVQMVYSEESEQCGLVHHMEVNQVEVKDHPVFSQPLGGVVPDIFVDHLVKEEVIGRPNA